MVEKKKKKMSLMSQRGNNGVKMGENESAGEIGLRKEPGIAWVYSLTI